ncbi:AraC family ligand binding domain-containing protein [Sphingobacterium siyangense]|uniref:AraC family ligand binding domain-containing protein n=1 Tax=Sphingobacterium siyangense TaxID=459529 RepID=UPI003DA31DCF
MRKKQFEPLRISEFIEDSFHLPPHEQNYYELVYIRSGKGTHVINKFELNYEPGDVFLISPADSIRPMNYISVDFLKFCG